MKRVLALLLMYVFVIASVFSSAGFMFQTPQGVKAAGFIDAYEKINPNLAAEKHLAITKDWLVESTSEGSWIKFEDVDFGSDASKLFKFEASCPQASNRPIQVRMNSLDGPVIANGYVKATESWSDYELQQIILEQEVTSEHDIFIIFNQGDGAGKWGGNFKWFRFSAIDPYQKINPIWNDGSDVLTAGDFLIENVGTDAWIKFKGVEFGDIIVPDTLEMEYSCDSATAGPIEIRLDSVDGQLIGTSEIASTGGAETFATKQIALNGINDSLGTHDLYMKFNTGDGATGGSYKWFQFSGKLQLAGIGVTAPTTVMSAIGQSLVLSVYGIAGVDTRVEIPDDVALAYETSDSEVVTVDSNGTVTVEGKGSAEIAVTGTAAYGIFTTSIQFDVVDSQETFFYVSSEGSDSNPGTIDLPFKTVQKAQTAVRTVIEGGMIGNITVYIREGVYNSYSNYFLSLNNSDSGRNGYFVKYAAYPGENPVFEGGKSITNWESVDNNIYRANIGTDWTFNSIFENDERVNIARTPNKGGAREGYMTVAAPMVSTDNKKKFHFNEGDIPEGLDPNTEELEIFIWAGGPKGIYNWHAALKKIVDIDYTNRIITLDSNVNYEIGPGSRYYIQGSMSMLDAPGEFYIDKTAGYLYYWPINSSISEQKIIAPKLRRIMSISGTEDSLVENIIVEGITMRNINYTRTIYYTSGVYLRNVRNISIKDNYIHGIGGIGIEFRDAAQNITISGNRIYDIGDIGILVQGNSGSTNMNHNTITNNLIQKVGRLVGHGHGIRLSNTNNTAVTHNRIFDSPRYAISMKGGGTTDNIIQYNDVFECNKDSQDTGLVEAWMAGAGNVIDHNRIYNSDIHFSFGFGIYLDDQSGSFRVSNNILHGLQQSGEGDLRNPILSKGVGNEFINNYVVNNPASSYGPFGSYDTKSENLSLSKNIFYNSGDVVYQFTGYNDDRFAFADYQLLFNENGQYRVVGVPGANNFDEWRTLYDYKFDQLSIIDNPQFMDESKDDYRIRYDSPARKLGIEEIDVANIGLKDTFKYGNSNDQLEYIYPVDSNGKTLSVLNLTSGQTVGTGLLGRTVTGYVSDLQGAAISYESNDSNVATVNGAGQVTSVSTGVAEITVTVVRGSETLATKYHVLVGDELESVEVKAARNTIRNGETTQLHIYGKTELGSYTLVKLDDERLDISIDKPHIIQVDQDGTISANSGGEATINVNMTINDVVTTGQVKVSVFDPIDAYSTINPERYGDVSGLTVEDNKIKNTAPDSWIMFNNVDFDETIPNILKMNVASEAGGSIDVRAGSLTGQLLGTSQVQATGGLTDFQEQTASLDMGVNLKGIHDIYFIFSESNSGDAGEFGWFSFDREPVGPSEPWMVKDYGDDTVSTIDVVDGTYTVVSNGANIWGADDEFTFIYQEIDESVADNFSVITTINSLYQAHADSGAGPIIRASDGSGVFNVSARVRASGGGLRFTWRNEEKPNTWYKTGPNIGFPATIKLTRQGDEFIAYYLGDYWIEYARIEVPMTGNVLAGVGVFSNASANTTAVVSDVSIDIANQPMVIGGTESKSANPNTGDSGIVVFGGVTIGCVIVLLLLTIKKRKCNEG